MAAIGDVDSMIPNDNVVMGVPKKGRLYDRCMKLLAGAGMDHRRVRGGEKDSLPQRVHCSAMHLHRHIFFLCCSVFFFF